MSHPIDLLEYVTSDRQLAVDEDKGVIRNVRILGLTSANGRTYAREAVRNAVGLYAGKVVNVNHVGRSGEARSAGDRLGWLEAVRQDDDGGLRGDLHYLKSHPMSGPLVEAAKRNPCLFGMSHTARGTPTWRDGAEVIESIEAVSSVDLVAEPASVNGLQEGKGGGVAKRTIKVKALIEALKPKRPKFSACLKEMAEAGVVGPDAEAAMPDQSAGDDADHTQAFVAGVVQAINKVLQDALTSGDWDDAADTVMKYIKTIKKNLGSKADGGDGNGDAGSSDEPADAPTPESRREKADANLREEVAQMKAEKTVRKVAGKAGVSLSEALVEALARPGMTEAQADAVVAELKGAGAGGGGERPRSAGPIVPARQQGQGAARGGTVQESRLPDGADAKGLARWLNGK